MLRVHADRGRARVAPSHTTAASDGGSCHLRKFMNQQIANVPTTEARLAHRLMWLAG